MAEPTKPRLRHLRDQLAAHADKPLPSELYQGLQEVLVWAAWRIDRPLTREQIRYQRWSVVGKFIRQFIAKHDTVRGSRKYAYGEAAKVLTGPYAGSALTMKDDYLFEEHAPSTDTRRVRYRETLERRAREADKKRPRSRRRG